MINTSTGSGIPYTLDGVRYTAQTPDGHFTVLRQINGLDISPLGDCGDRSTSPTRHRPPRLAVDSSVPGVARLCAHDQRGDRLDLGQQRHSARHRGLGLLSNLDGVVEGDGDDAIVHVHVQPRAGRSELVGRHGKALKVRVTAPPVDGRANAATAAVLAAALRVAPSRVVLVSGAQSRIKRFRVTGLARAEVALRLAAAI